MPVLYLAIPLSATSHTIIDSPTQERPDLIDKVEAQLSEALALY